MELSDKIPYFMTNKDWYYYEDYTLKLTDKAPKKAINSYYEYYKELRKKEKEFEKEGILK